MLGASYSSASSNSLRLVSGEGKPSGAGPPDPRRLATPNDLTQIKREVRVWVSRKGAKGEAGAGNSPGVAQWRSCGSGWRRSSDWPLGPPAR